MHNNVHTVALQSNSFTNEQKEYCFRLVVARTFENFVIDTDAESNSLLRPPVPLLYLRLHMDSKYSMRRVQCHPVHIFQEEYS